MGLTQLKPGDRGDHRCPGRRRLRDPFEREPEMVADDVREGFVSMESARKEYGVEIDPETHEVDMVETEKLRESLRSKV